MLIARAGLAPGEPPETVNLTRSDLLGRIAAEYLEAGAEIVTTNTFGGSPLRLRPYRLELDMERINRAAVRAVRTVVGPRAYVSASVGPSGRLLVPLGDVTPRELESSFVAQARALAEAGVDLFCVETMTDLEEACIAVRAIKAEAPAVPVIATMTFEATRRGPFTVMGVSVDQAARGLTDAGADVVGSNCGHGIEAMVAIARAFRAVTDTPLAVRANAGIPESRQGALVFPETPAFVAARAHALLEAGVQIVGGCCGTTPEHVRAMRQALPTHR
jgi:5-methyltetrahydrofolate--homocysteine methyltransferase